MVRSFRSHVKLHDDGLVLVADAGADLADGVDAVSYTHLTLPTSDLV